MRFDIDKRFWATVSFEDFVGIAKRGGLNADECARLWRIQKLPGEPPPSLEISVRREDVMRVFPPMER